MPSPFPGMDPWLEDEEVFPNLHDRLIIGIQDALNAAMPPGYVATSRNRVWVDDQGRRDPDVALFRQADRPPPGVTVGVLAGLTVVGVERASDPVEEIYLEIVSGRGKRLVTAVEVISPSNKRAGKKGRKAYRDKQREYRHGGINLVEVDLLRRGPHVTAAPRARLRRVLGEYDYHASVTVPREKALYFGVGVRMADRLPGFGIPLDPGVPAVTVDLQPLLDRAYDNGRYPELVDYRRPCDPPLTAEQQAWADGVLRGKGLVQ